MIETNNMYHASYYLCEGLNISDVKKEYDNRLGETVYFIFTGNTEELEQAIKAKFDSGIAVCNIRAYLTSVVTIRNIMRNTLKGTSLRRTTEGSKLKNNNYQKERNNEKNRHGKN